jgi:hypothetical protein
MLTKFFAPVLFSLTALLTLGCENSSPDFPPKIELNVPEIPELPKLACVEALNKYLSFAKSNCCEGEASFEVNHEAGSVILDCSADNP